MKRRVSTRKPKGNATVEVKRIGQSVVMYINPLDEKTGIALSRFYLLTESDGKLDTTAFGPCDMRKEEDRPVTLMVHVKGRSKPFSRTASELFADSQ